VHNDGVPVAGESQQFRELWPGRVPARGLVREDPFENLAFKLSFLVFGPTCSPARTRSAVQPRAPPSSLSG
jgi:hypothetical protein